MPPMSTIKGRRRTQSKHIIILQYRVGELIEKAVIAVKNKHVLVSSTARLWIAPDRALDGIGTGPE